MAKKIRFPLVLAGETQVRTLDELREHFDLERVLEYYKNGKLLTWLEDRYLEGEAEAVRALDETGPDFQRQLCAVFQVEYTGNDVDLDEIERRQERLKRLREITDNAEFIQNIDRVAFDQEELADLLDEGEAKIYLCGEKSTVPASRKGITYVGIKNPAVHISGNVPGKPEELGIEFEGVNCDNLPKMPVRKEVPARYCPICGYKSMGTSSRFCPQCGAPMGDPQIEFVEIDCDNLPKTPVCEEVSTKECPICKTKCDVRFCPNCGALMDD